MQRFLWNSNYVSGKLRFLARTLQEWQIIILLQESDSSAFFFSLLQKLGAWGQEGHLNIYRCIQLSSQTTEAHASESENYDYSSRDSSIVVYRYMSDFMKMSLTNNNMLLLKTFRGLNWYFSSLCVWKIWINKPKS